MSSDVALSYQDERPYEMMDGVEYMMASPSVNHMRINSNIDSIFNKYLDGKRCEAFINTNVYFSEEDHFIPDEIIVCNPDIVEDKGINGTPDLVVEILSPSTATDDRNKKLKKYEKYGVKEYWIVDPRNKLVEVYLLKDGKLELDNVYAHITEEERKYLSAKEKAGILTDIKVSLYDDFIINVKDIFKRVK